MIFLQTITEELEKKFGDEETRHAIAAEHVTTGVPIQLHEMREARGWTQKELAERAGMAQERICVLEDPNYKFLPKINTLLKFAEVFDVPLIVRFGTWSELLNWEKNLSPETLAPLSFDDEQKLYHAQNLMQPAYAISGTFENVLSIPVGSNQNVGQSRGIITAVDENSPNLAMIIGRKSLGLRYG